MKKNLSGILFFLLASVTWMACSKDKPVDADGLLITTRKDCYVSSFELVGTDYVSVRVGTAVIDTTAQTIKTVVQFGTDLKNLYPQFTLAQDCKLDPKVVGRTDFSDTLHPKVWSVISGDRQIKKPYTITISVQPR